MIARLRIALLLVAIASASGCASFAYLAAELTPLPPDSVAAPDLTGRSRIRLVVFGDAGTGDAGQIAVAQAMHAVCARPGEDPCDFALVLGDNIYTTGVSDPDDSQFARKFERPYGPLGDLPFSLVPGNHDWRRPESVQAQIDYSLRSPRWRMPSNHYAVPQLPEWLRVYGLDTTVMFDLAGERDAAKVSPLERSRDEQLAAADAALCGAPGWKLLFAHHPLYSSGQHGMEEGADGTDPTVQPVLEPLIRRCGVQLVFGGHEHHQEYVRADGFEQFVQGAGGRALRDLSIEGLPDASRRIGFSEFGFALVTLDANAVEVVFYRPDPAERYRELYRWNETRAAYSSP